MSGRLGLGLLFLALVFALVFFFPETRISREPLNDLVLHRAAAERLAGSLANGEPFLDPWVSEWSLGYPFWRSYQPLPHLLAVGWLALTSPFAGAATSFAWLHYLVVATLPLSVFVGARGLGLSALGAGAAAVLALAPSAAGELDRYGLSFGAVSWRGSGLFTQVVALHFLLLALAAVRRAVEEGRRLWLASLFLAATALSHIVFAYVAVVSALVVALVAAERGRALVRAVWLLGGAGLLVLWFYAPLALDLAEANRSRWEASFKWDSFGAGTILSELWRGGLLDHGRWPVLTALVALSTLAAILQIRHVVARRLLALALLWLGLWFGRATWGGLLAFAGIPAAFHLHRLQAAFELFACLLAAFGVESLFGLARRFGVLGGAVVAVAFLSAMSVAAAERARYLGQSAEWGEQSLAAIEREHGNLEKALVEVKEVLAERPGRVVAGKAATWGRQFRVGSLPVYSFLTREHLDQASFLYHSMSLTSDVMVLRDEANHAHDVAFGIRAIIAPANRPMHGGVRLRGSFGRFAVYEASAEGYFGLVDVGAVSLAPVEARHDVNTAWLGSEHLRWGVVAALGEGPPGLPTFGRNDPLPPIAPAMRAPRGRIVTEEKLGERYRARVALVRPCYAYVKITYHQRLVATVDGKEVPLLRVTPGFAAVPVDAGEHAIEVAWRPGPLKPFLFVAGVLGFALLAVAERRAPLLLFERRAHAVLSPNRALRPSRVSPLGVDSAALFLFAGFSSFYYAIGPGNFFSVDEVVAEEAAAGIAERGTVEVPAMNTTLRGRGGGYYTVKGPGLSWASVPLVALGQSLDDRRGTMNGGALRGPPLGTPEHPLRWSGRFANSAALVANALLGGACVALLFLFGLRFTDDPGASLRMAIAGGTATLLASEATHFFQHPLQALALLLAAFFFSTTSAAATYPLCGGLAIGVALLSGAEALPAALVLWTVGIVRARARGVALVALVLATVGPLVAVVLFLHHNWLRFGSPLSFGYDFAHGVAGVGSFAVDVDPLRAAKAIAAYLVGPAHSVFLFAPPLFLALFAARESLRRSGWDAAIVALAAAAHGGLVTVYGSWHGAICYGPRFMLAPMLLLLPLALPAFERNGSTVRLAVAAGVVVQLLGVAIYVTANEWYRVAAGVDLAGGFAFVPSASPIAVHARALANGEHLAPFALRAFANPGAALALWIALGMIAILCALRLRSRAAAWSSVPADGSRFAIGVVILLFALELAGFARTKPVDAPREPRILAFLQEGIAAQRAARPVAASEWYALVLGLEPTNPFALYDLGVLAHEAGRVGEAMRLYRRTLALDPSFQPARHNLRLLGGSFP